MAGGIWKTQNKTRPGVYINFKGVAKPASSVGIRGVVTMPVPMSWGEGVIELFSTDLIDGKSLPKIGYTAFDPEAQIFREALKNCYKGYFFRSNSGGTKANKTQAPITVTAKYTGVVGNRISFSVVANGAKFDVITLFDGVEKDRQTVATISELISNGWVDFTGTGALTEIAGANLTQGTDGLVSDENYTTYFSVIQSYNWNTMGIPVNNATLAPLVKNFIENMRENIGRKVQAVLYNYPSADYEGIISVNQSYKTATETISAETFVAYAAGLTAGSDADTSNTYHVIEGATEIIPTLTETEIEAALKCGQMVISTRQDGVIIIEQDINTLHTFTPEKGYTFSKNRVIRTLDEINNSITLLFAKSYIGKVSNNENGRTIFKADIISYFNNLQKIGAIQDFDSANDVVVSAGEAVDAVVVDLAVKPVDSMEKLYMTVLVG
jgi:hypothetical protein